MTRMSFLLHGPAANIKDFVKMKAMLMNQTAKTYFRNESIFKQKKEEALLHTHSTENEDYLIK